MRNRLILLLFISIIIAIFSSGLSTATELKTPVPDISAKQWLNSQSLNWGALKGKVVMVEFWTFGCSNCKAVEPHIKSWYQKYQPEGLEIVAVHSPEFNHERNIDNVREYIKDHAITYPVAIDNDFAIWRRFSNRYWPAMYIVDKQGMIRFRFIGEGRYDEIENILQKLLAEQTPG